MKLTTVITAVLFPHSITASFKGASRAAPAIEEQVNLSSFANEFDPTALLESRPRNSEIFTKAMIELKRLESEQTCHRLAAQLLMDNCRDVTEMSDDDSQLRNTQNHHVESFANGLTLCDLSRGKFDVSNACSPFTASALLQAYQTRNGKLDVSHDQTSACIEALAKDHSQWITWMMHRDNALLYCRAVRLDIDKDETISLHKKLTQLMAEFAQELELDLEYVESAMKKHVRKMDSVFEGTLSQAELLKVTMQSTLNTILNEAQDLSHSIRATEGRGIDLQRMLKVLVDTAIASNAELAAAHEQALMVTTELTTSRMADMDALAENAISTIDDLKNVIRDHILPTVASVNERQDAVEQKFEIFNAALNQMTYAINNHTESIEQASITAKAISQSLGQAQTVAKFWIETLGLSGKASDLALRILLPTFMLVLGSYGLPPSMIRNGGLVLSGYAIAESAVQMRRCNWDWTDWADGDSETPSSVTQLAREKLGSLTTAAVEIELVEPLYQIT